MDRTSNPTALKLEILSIQINKCFCIFNAQSQSGGDNKIDSTVYPNYTFTFLQYFEFEGMPCPGTSVIINTIINIVKTCVKAGYNGKLQKKKIQKKILLHILQVKCVEHRGRGRGSVTKQRHKIITTLQNRLVDKGV